MYILIIINICIFLIIYFLKDKKKVIISLEGNIGTGKSTMMQLLKNKLGDNAEYIDEPVDKWLQIKDKNGKDILKTFYDNKERWGYTFQSLACITRINRLIRAILHSPKEYIFIDRSLKGDLIFAKMLYDDGVINDIEWQSYNEIIKLFEDNYGNLIDSKIIYLRCEPNVSYDRIKKRSRD